MRMIVLTTATVIGIGLLAVTSVSALPANGGVIHGVANLETATQQIHCRRYPHRHRFGIPHRYGFGCR
jgi:hypothetical protein